MNDINREEQLRKYEYIISVSDELMSFIGPDYTYQAVNDMYLKSHDKTREEIINHTIAELHGEAVFNNVIKDRIDRCFQGETVRYEGWFELKASGRRFMSVTLHPYKAENDSSVSGVVVIARDITDQKQYEEYRERTEKALRHSHDMLKKAQQLASIGSWEWNLATDTVTFTDEYYHLFGFPSNEQATREDCLGRIHPEDIDAVNKAVEDALHGNSQYSIEYRINLPGGLQRYVHGMGEVVRDENNNPVLFHGTVHDITERKLAENILKQSHDELEQHVRERTADLQRSNEQLLDASRAKSQFLTRMSHELRTPLNSIIGFAQLLEINEKNNLTGNQKNGVGHILKSGWHLLELVNDLLDLAAIEADKLEFHIEPVNLAGCVGACLDIMAPLAEQRDISLINTMESCGNKCVLADQVRLRQVLLNLLSNAVKYNRNNGKVTLNCTLAEADTLRISISDTGPGIAEEDIAILFEPFNRLYLDSYALEGTGIGLTITKQLVENMGGRIGVASKPGHGSTFWVEFRLCQPAAIIQPLSEPASSKAISGDSATLMLYIEDSPVHIELMEELVDTIPGTRLMSAHTPRLGLELAQTHKPDIIILDIGLPGMDGFEVLEQLRKHEATQDIPVIALSANAMTADIEKGLRAGFSRYLTKPIDISEFRKAVNELLPDNAG